MLKWALVLAVAVAGSLSDVLNTIGMKRHGEVQDLRPGALGRMLAGLRANGYILAGLAAAAVSFFSLLALLSVSDVTFAVPATSASYLVETVFAKYVLKERIGCTRWAGVSLVAGGVYLLAW